MSVASHLGINLTEYDSRIRTFIPNYEEMLDVAAAAVPARAATIVDLGIGTGALSSRCLATARKARAVGIDVDPAMLALAKRRLEGRATLVAGSFLRATLPKCDALVASFALHHVRTRGAKRSLYRRIRSALRPGGLFISVDCQPASDASVRRAQFDAWLSHLRTAYPAPRARAILASWAHEDVYVPLDAELALMHAAGFRVELLWRRGAFAVIRAVPSFRTKIVG
jgi:SAM-dependent methyltransferase